jgi:tetratricopeptide (TPR) repeat protein
MAWVYLAEDSNENRLVAVKILYPQFGEDLSYIQRFNREAKLASTLTDPHIVRVLDYGADRDVHYLVMEYVEGQDLREALNYEGRFPWRDALEIIDQLAAALEHAHLHGVVHRDIKPQNMMLDESGLLKVLDFGIARVPTLPSLTQSGFIGSPYYVSPEQAMGEEVDTRADIYSSGIVLYELLSGNIPFDAKSPWSIISQHIANDPPPIELDNDEVPEGVHRLLDKMIAKRAEDRFQTPTALRRAIAAVLAGQPIPESTLETQPIEPIDRSGMAESLYQRALEAINTEEWARAVDLLNQALKFNPDHAEASEKFGLAERKAHLVALYNTARRAMVGGLWNDAITNLNRVIEVEPGYRDAEALLIEAREALKKEDTQKFVATRYEEGMIHFEAARWDNAIEAFQEVKNLAPNYERVDQLLSEAERFSHPNLIQKLVQIIGGNSARETGWRWALIAVGILAIVGLTFFSFASRTPTVAEDDVQQRLKGLYEQAQQAVEAGNPDRALVFLDQILAENPDYADAAGMRRDLVATLTPAAGSFAPLQGDDPLAGTLQQAQTMVDNEQWSEAVDQLAELRSTDANYEQARVASLFCDAYIGRGLDVLSRIDSSAPQQDIVKAALADFEAGAEECPRRVDLQDQAERAEAYLEALETPQAEYDRRIQLLTPIVAAEPDYAGNKAKQLLYEAYLERGNARQEASEIVGALSDYEAALALNVDDPSQAQRARAELLLAFSQVPVEPIAPVPAETTEPVEGAETPAANAETTPTLTPEEAGFEYNKPQLIGPPYNAIFAGPFAEVFLEWSPVGRLASDEYYDLTVMHIHANQPNYWGTATKDTRVKVPTAIGVGQAGEDRFYWWVTVRKANTAPPGQNLDLPLSPESEPGQFFWSP